MQDGSISEAVSWECPPSHRHTIPDQILQHILPRRMGAQITITPHSGLLEPCLAAPSYTPAQQLDASRCAWASFRCKICWIWTPSGLLYPQS